MMCGNMTVERRRLCGLFWMAALIAAASGQSFSNFVEVQFQPSTRAPCAPSQLIDSGEAYGPKGGGFTYGWLLAGTDSPQSSTGVRDRNRSERDCVENTLMHMQYNDCCSGSNGFDGHLEWEIVVPNGRYRVSAIMGDFSTNSIHYLRDTYSDTVILAASTPPARYTYFSGSAEVLVSTGKLRLSAEGEGFNAKLNYVKIDREVEETGDPPPSENGPCVPNPSQFEGRPISPLRCDLVLVDLPYRLNFFRSVTGIQDRNGRRTGMRVIIPSTSYGRTYQRWRLEMKTGYLQIRAPSNTWEGTSNSAPNALGVGLPLPGKSVRIKARVRLERRLEAIGAEGFCIFVAVSQTEYAELCAKNVGGAYVAATRYEVGDEEVSSTAIPTELTGGDVVTLRMDIYPSRSEIETYYERPGQEPVQVNTMTVEGFTLNVDIALTDSAVGTRSNGGVRSFRAPGQRTVKFELQAFDVEEITMPVDTGTGNGQIDFDVSRFTDIQEPTSMTWAPNGRLFVASVRGSVHAFRFNSDRTAITERRTYNPIGAALLLGITVDPNYASNKCLWLGHSYVSRSDGVANSGKITRVCGDELTSVEDIIVGLPRAIANHAVNNLKFHPTTGELFICVGGNTGSGAPNDIEGASFGPRPEQVLSAAILRAPVFDPDFMGDCTPVQDPDEMDATGTGAKEIPACNVSPYATGTRNVFDCAFHPNGKLYCPDNGIGGRGTFPNLPPGFSEGDTCDGPVTGTDATANDPGVREDLLYDVAEGAYYGHPNPARLECVLAAGNPTSGADGVVRRLPIEDNTNYPLEERKYPVGVQPRSNFRRAMVSFGKNRSPDGTIVYESQKMCGQLFNQLLVVWFSVDPQVRRIKFSGDGGSVVEDGTLRRSTESAGGTNLDKPLGIAQDPDGNVYVGEFGGDAITVYRPKTISCSRRTVSMNAPPMLADAATVTGHGDKLFVFGGRVTQNLSRRAYVYDSKNDVWNDLPALPHQLADSGAAQVDGAVYVVGGVKHDGTLSDEVFRFDPSSGIYEPVEALPEPRAGACVHEFRGRLVVAGGRTADGDSASTLSLENGSWKRLDDMIDARSFAAGAVVDGAHLLMCGGINNGAVMPFCESFDGTRWTSTNPMPTAKTHAAAFSFDGGKFVIKGGQHEDGSINDDVELFDFSSRKWLHLGHMRTGRSGALTAKLRGELYSFGGRTATDITRRGDILYL